MKDVGHRFGGAFNSELTKIYRCAAKITGKNETAVHEIRKSCKKIRALLKLASPAIGKKLRKKGNKAFKEIASNLSKSRDRSVQARLYRNLLKEAVELELAPKETMENATQRIQKWTRQSYGEDGNLEALRKEIQKKSYQQALFSRNFPLEKISEKKLSKGMEVQRDKMIKARKIALKNPTPENAHEWRKKVKYSYYQMEQMKYFGRLQKPKRVGRLKKLSDRLGELHDLDVLINCLVCQEGDLPPGSEAVAALALDKRERVFNSCRELV